MVQELDFKSWASHPSLSPHEIACLFLGVRPSKKVPAADQRDGLIPAIPDDYFDDVDHKDWDSTYVAIYRNLRAAIAGNLLPCAASGNPSPADAIEYLARVAEENGWGGWLFDCPFYKAVKGKKEVDGFPVGKESVVSSAPSLPSDYTNPSLEWQKRAINEFYANRSPEDLVTVDFVAKWIVDSAREEGQEMTWTDAKRIAVILNPLDRRKGGRPKRK